MISSHHHSRARVSLALILGLACLALAACGSSSKSSSGASSSSGSGHASKSGKPGAPITIGASMEETGAEAIPSLPVGYKVAVAQANAQGGIVVGGVRHKINFTLLDNRSDPSLLASQLHTLVLQDHAVALVTGCCDLNVAEAPLANALHIPLMGTAIPIDLMTKVNGQWAWDAFTSLESSLDYFTKVVPSLGKTDGKVAEIANNNPQGQGANGVYAAAAKAAHFTVTDSALVPAGTTNYSSFISKAKSTGADNLVVQMDSPDCFALWKQMKALGYHPKTIAANQCGAIPTWKTLGSLGNGAIIGLNWTPSSGLPNAGTLAATFGKTFPGDVADQEVAVNSYNAMELLFSAIEKAGSTVPAKINAAIGKTNGSFALGHVTFDSHHDFAGGSYLSQWQNGKVVQVYPKVSGVTPEFPASGLK